MSAGTPWLPLVPTDHPKRSSTSRPSFWVSIGTFTLPRGHALGRTSPGRIQGSGTAGHKSPQLRSSGADPACAHTAATGTTTLKESLPPVSHSAPASPLGSTDAITSGSSVPAKLCSPLKKMAHRKARQVQRGTAPTTLLSRGADGLVAPAVLKRPATVFGLVIFAIELFVPMSLPFRLAAPAPHGERRR